MKTTFASPTELNSLRDAVIYFADADRALAFMVEMRWPDGVTCPQCEAADPMFLKTRRIWKCRDCRKQFTAKVGTIFEDSPLGFDKWFPALWLLANAKNGISSYELARALDVTQKTAWFMLGRIRLAMQTKTFKKMTGKVEADESWIGGKRGNMHKSKKDRIRVGSTKHQQAVMGLLQRKRGRNHSRVRLQHIPSTKKAPMAAHIEANVAKGSNLYTDAHPTYARLAAIRFGDMYKHEAVDHAVEYARGQVHTNGLENFWSLLKRTVRGTYISVDPFHLFRYLDEQAFRFNEREENDRGRFFKVVADVVGKRLSYENLIGGDMVPATT